MVAIVVGAHGNFSRELIRSCEMILGPRDNIAAVTLEPGESADSLVGKYQNAVNSLDSKDGVLFMTDLFGGSPYNAACKLAIGNDKIGIVSGVNLSMILEILSLQSLSVAHIVEQAQTAGKQGIKAFRIKDMSSEEEEDL
jgi:PTS system mannose-specific IIA component